MDELFPKIQKSIETLIEDEEGNINGFDSGNSVSFAGICRAQVT